jgi:SAM-dependent methyltransferase
MSSDRPIANVGQAEAWNGDEGEHWATHDARYDAMGGAFTDALFAAAAIAETDTVLDIGCGTGQSTRRAAVQAPRGRAVGIDLSEPMLHRARDLVRGEGIGNVAFEQGDAQVHPLPSAAFDVAISRFGIMFFDDPIAAFANIARALRPRGRLAVLCWQDMARNDWLMVPATAALQHVPFPDLGEPGGPGPFSLADPATLRGTLEAVGFEQVEVNGAAASMRLGDDADDAREFLRGMGPARALLDDADDEAAARALDAVTDALRPHERTGGVYLDASAWLATAHRMTSMSAPPSKGTTTPTPRVTR